MNRYPTWKYLLIAVVVLLGLLYTLPNFYGSTPAVQVTAKTESGLKLDEVLRAKVEAALVAEKVPSTGVTLDSHGIRARFADEDTQQKGKGVIENALVPDKKLEDAPFTIALALLSNSPNWLTAVHALPTVSYTHLTLPTIYSV